MADEGGADEIPEKTSMIYKIRRFKRFYAETYLFTNNALEGLESVRGTRQTEFTKIVFLDKIKAEPSCNANGSAYL